MQKRRRFKQVYLEEQLLAEAMRLQEQADALPHGREREEIVRKAQQAEAASRMSDWSASPVCGHQREHARKTAASLPQANDWFVGNI